MLSTCLASSPPPRYSFENVAPSSSSSIRFDPASRGISHGCDSGHVECSGAPVLSGSDPLASSPSGPTAVLAVSTKFASARQARATRGGNRRRLKGLKATSSAGANVKTAVIQVASSSSDSDNTPSSCSDDDDTGGDGSTADETETVRAPRAPALSAAQLRRAPVLTICGIKIQSSLEDFVRLGEMVDAGMLIRDRMDTVNLVFRDEATRKRAFRVLESREAHKLLDEHSQYETFYVAWRPQADIAFYQIEPLDVPVFDERRRIYLRDEFKPCGFELGPSDSIVLPPVAPAEHDATLMEITSISAFFAS
ncbi:hypothetical protein JCM3766R1_000239 [Sporobolomyces carnicolor]